MLQAKAIDVLLSLAFIYLLFSIAVSGLYELYQSRYNRRGKFLRKILDNVLNDPLNKNFADEFYYHPLIDTVKESKRVFPSKVSATHFTDVITDILQYRAREKSLEFDHETKTYKVNQDNDYDTLSPFDKLKKGIEALNDSPFKRIAESWIFDIAQDADKNAAIQKAKANIERWYEHYTERTGGWFKRDLRKRMLVLGIVIALLFNVNSIILVEFLWKEDAQREIIVNRAINYVHEADSINNENRVKLVKAAEDYALRQKAMPDDTSIAMAPLPVVPPDTLTQTQQLDTAMSQNIQTAEKAKDILEELDLPIGWDNFMGYKKDYFELKENTTGWWPTFRFWALAILGWICTGFAISFGADFWYNALKKLIEVRKTVKEGIK